MCVFACSWVTCTCVCVCKNVFIPMSCSVGLNAENFFGKMYSSTSNDRVFGLVTLKWCWPRTTRIWDLRGLKRQHVFLSILDICQILVLRAALSQTTAGSISKNCLQIFNPQILWHLLPAIICSTIAKNRKKSKQVHCHEINLLVLQHCNMTWC